MKIIKRCFYCNPRHLMDEDGNPVPGEIIKGYPYSDGIRKVAMPIAREESRCILEEMRVKKLLERLR